MSRLRRIAPRALGAASTALLALGAVSSGSVGDRGPAPPGQGSIGQAREATSSCTPTWSQGNPTGAGCSANGACCSGTCGPGGVCACAPLGGTCQSDMDCCGADFCSPPTGGATLGTCALCPSSLPNGTKVQAYNPNKNVFWGNLHQHTSFSLDAYNRGATTSPADAYAFADGAEPSLTVAAGASSPGPTITTQQTLDFLAITDHSEWLALTYGCADPAKTPFPGVLGATDPSTNASWCAELSTATTSGVTTYDWFDKGGGNASSDVAVNAICAGSDTKGGCSANGDLCLPAVNPCASYADAWNALISAANDANDACAFTSLVGYEWTGMTGSLSGEAPGTGNANHRNVIFNNGTNVPAVPCDSNDCAQVPTELWQSLDATCSGSDTGCDAVVIPHNTNESSGLSLLQPGGTTNAWNPSGDGPGTAAWNDQLHYQVAVEIYQHKGSSECFPPEGVTGAPGSADPAGMPQGKVDYMGSAPDAACNFENSGVQASTYSLSYVRPGLASGIGAAANNGVGMLGNHLQLGIVGSTDDHNGAAGYVQEEVYAGHGANEDDTAWKRLNPNLTELNQWGGSGGLTGVWAEQNTRDRIFSAIQRRETFATSGPRIQVRFYQYSPSVVSDPCGVQPGAAPFPASLVENGAVPMGGTFGPNNLGAAPQGGSFVVWYQADTWPQIPANSPACTSDAGCASNDCNTALGVCAEKVGIQTVQVIKGYSQGGTTYEDGAYALDSLDTAGPSPGGNFDVIVPLVGGQGTGCATFTDANGAPGAKGGSFNTTQYGFYYVRALQAPTYRWSHWDCNPEPPVHPTSGTCPTSPNGTLVPCTSSSCAPNTCVPQGCNDAFVTANDQIQERAWSSPIWYSPTLEYSVVAGTGALGDYPPATTLGPTGVQATSTSPQTMLGGQPGANYLSGMAKDAAGNLYIADAGNAVIRKVDTSGFISVFAGTGAPGPAAAVGTGKPATQATLNGPSGVAVDSKGNVYFSEFNNNDVRVVDTTGTIWTYAILSSQPTGISIDGSNDIYVAMWSRPTIVKLSWNGPWTPGAAPTPPGNARWAGTVGPPGYNPGEATGVATPLANVLFDNPNGVFADTFGNVYVDDANNGVIRKYNGVAGKPGYGCFTTIAGVQRLGPGPKPAISPSLLPQNVQATSVQINSLYGVVADTLGNVFIADSNNNAIRMIDPAGNIHTLTPGNGSDPVYPAYHASLSPTAWTSGAAANLLLSQPGYAWMDSNGGMYFSDLTDNVYKLGIH